MWIKKSTYLISKTMSFEENEDSKTLEKCLFKTNNNNKTPETADTKIPKEHNL